MVCLNCGSKNLGSYSHKNGNQFILNAYDEKNNIIYHNNGLSVQLLICADCANIQLFSAKVLDEKK